jgi:hypothetical protein
VLSSISCNDVLTNVSGAVHPDDDEIGGDADFGGLWSAYPYFASGYILLNTVERGLFVVKYNKTD